MTVTGCTNTASNTNLGKNVYVQSLSQTSIGPVTVSGDVSFGSVGPITLSIPQVRIPQPTGMPTLYASGYLWTLPAGWRFGADNHISDGFTPHLINSVSAYSIQVFPAAGSGGTVTVRAVDTICGLNSPGSLVVSESLPASVTITRPLPTVRIISNRTPTGGNTTLNCGDRTDYRWRAEVVGGQPGGAFSYQWFASDPAWQIICCSTSANTLIIPSGTSGTTISLTSTYQRNGATANLAVTPVIVGYSQSVQTPVFTEGGNMCLGETRTFKVAPIPGATSYTWELSPRLYTPLLVTTVPYIDVTAPSNTSDFNGYVKVTAGRSGCGSSYAVKDFQLGTGDAFISSPYVKGTQVCGGSTITLTAEVDRDQYNAQNDTYQWTVSGGTILSGQGSPFLEVVTPPEGQWMDVRVTFNNSCSGYKRADIGVQSTYQFYDGTYCLQQRPATPPATVYPNPTADYLHVPVERAGSSVQLLNAQGQVKFTQAVQKAGTVVLDVRQLPEGLYHLRVTGGKTTVSRQVRVQR